MNQTDDFVTDVYRHSVQCRELSFFVSSDENETFQKLVFSDFPIRSLIKDKLTIHIKSKRDVTELAEINLVHFCQISLQKPPHETPRLLRKTK